MNVSSPRPPRMISFINDLPNICSLIGLFSALLGIYYAFLGIFPAAMISMLWAVFFDWSDGIIARRMKGRTEEQKLFGVQFDSLIDIVSFSVCPAVLLLSYGKFNPWLLPGAFVIVGAGALRLSYFNVFGLVGKSTYMGMALDNNIIILAFVFLFSDLIGQTAFTIVLYSFIIAIAVLNVAPIHTPKFSGRWYYILIGYILVLTFLFARQL